MGKKELKGRAVWQDYSGANAAVAEKGFHGAFEFAFKDTPFRIRSKPKEFSKIYTNVALDPSVASEIYNPPEGINRHGISPDYAIDNTHTNKTLYVEVKRQDGWVTSDVPEKDRPEWKCRAFDFSLFSHHLHKARCKILA